MRRFQPVAEASLVDRETFWLIETKKERAGNPPALRISVRNGA